MSGPASTGGGLESALVAIAAALVDARDELNQLDGAAGDGDLGLTAGRAAEALREIAPSSPSWNRRPRPGRSGWRSRGGRHRPAAR